MDRMRLSGDVLRFEAADHLDGWTSPEVAVLSETPHRCCLWRGDLVIALSDPSGPSDRLLVTTLDDGRTFWAVADWFRPLGPSEDAS